MKKQILTAVILGSLSISAFALPQNNPQPLLGEAQDSSVQTLMGVGANLQTEGGAARLQERLRVAEDGAERVDPNRIAEGGAERVGQNRVAEGGAERALNQRTS